MKTALYHNLIEHENVRLLDREYSVRIFQETTAGKVSSASNELQELSLPLVLLCDIGSFLVVCSYIIHSINSWSSLTTYSACVLGRNYQMEMKGYSTALLLFVVDYI